LRADRVTEPAPASRAASTTGTIVSRMTTDTTAFTSGSCCPSRIAPKIHRGSVFCAPAVNTVTMTSSKDRPNASSAPDTRAVAVSGSVT
jgi:hypothetical protein